MPSIRKTTPLVFSSSIPTLTPSIIFAIIFFLTTILHLNRYINYRRKINLCLLMFSCNRVIGFCIRIAESVYTKSEALAIASGVIVTGSFFLVIMGLYILLIGWIKSVTNLHAPTKRLSWEVKIVKIAMYFSPLFSIYGVVGIIRLYDNEFNDYDNYDSYSDYIYYGKNWMLASTLGFLLLMLIYSISITYFAFVYGEKPVRKQLKIFVLYVSGALIFIELIYRMMMTLANATDSINRYTWIFYVFEIVPEVILLIILGGVILGEWFFKESYGTVTLGVSGLFPKNDG